MGGVDNDGDVDDVNWMVVHAKGGVGKHYPKEPEGQARNTSERP